MNILNIALAFIEGLGLILSPCILPVLPLMLAASLDGGRKRPLGIITGFIIAFTGFALLSRQILGWLHVGPDAIRNAALIFLILFGIVMLSKKLSDKLISLTQSLANAGQNLTARWDQKNGYFSGVAIGALIGLIWAPCAGPIMAAAIVQIIQAQTNIDAVLTVIAFAAGAGLPMLLIALAGRQIMTRLSFLKTHSYAVRRILGVVIIAAGLLIYSGADVQLLASTNAPPTVSSMITKGMLNKGLAQPYPAPELADGEWLNTTPLKISDLRGKVVLIDFWTYSCINCVRTLPYITSWDEKYRDKGLVIIGIHSPEFEFEKNAENVKAALAKYNIRYPVLLDNGLASWNNFQNKYWPAHYLIDKDGRVVYAYFGEGDYDVTENNIRALLGLDQQHAQAAAETFSTNQTPETYLGYKRSDRFDNSASLDADAAATYTLNDTPAQDHWSLSGKWTIGAEKITSSASDAKLRLHFQAKKVFLVMGTSDNKPHQISITLNGKPLDNNAGKDATGGAATIDGHALYELVNSHEAQSGVLDITATSPNIEMYAFTFGE